MSFCLSFNVKRLSTPLKTRGLSRVLLAYSLRCSVTILIEVFDCSSFTEFGSCRTGWKDFGQFCYQFNLVKKSWSAARAACVSQQADLVSIHSPVEQSHITLEVGPYGLQSQAWIGNKFFCFLNIEMILLN